MKTVKVRVVLQLPEVLARPLPADASDAETTRALHALFAWAKVQPPADIKGDVQGDAPWPAAATRLALEALPCFAAMRRRTRKKGGAPRKGTDPALMAYETDAYLESGGTLLTSDAASVERYQQALFVECVRDAKGNKTLGHAFRRLAKDQSTLPPRYRRLRTAKSLESAYKDIPKAIRDDPASAIPQMSPLAAAIGARLLRLKGGG